MEGAATLGTFKYPFELAPRGDTVDEYLSGDGTTKVTVTDPYRFLEDPDSAATKQWVEAQNKITDAFLNECDTKDLLKEKLSQCWNYPKITTPSKKGDHYYFQYNTGLQNQFVMYKVLEKNTLDLSKENPLEGTVVFIDPNTLAADGTASLDSKVFSENGRYMAYQVKRAGSDWATMYVKDTETLEDLPHDELKWIKFSGMSWTHDNLGFFYSKFDSPTEDMGAAGKETEKLQF